MTKTSKTVKSSGPKPQIVFFGSGPVAAKSLELLKSDFGIEAVITKSATVEEMTTVSDGAPVFAVANKAELNKLIEQQKFTSQVGILIDFGIIVDQIVIDSFKFGIVNSHFSLLPQWRGADPITFSILSGQKKTGVSLMLLVQAMDEGPVIACGIQELSGDETAPELTESLIYLSDALLKKELPRYLSGDTKGAEQDKLPELIPDYPSEASYSRKLTKEDGLLDYKKPAEVLEREVRAFQQWPKSYTKLGDVELVVTQAHVDEVNGQPGQLKLDGKKLLVHCSEGSLSLDKVKPAGKNVMTIEAFLAGYKNKIGL